MRARQKGLLLNIFHFAEFARLVMEYNETTVEMNERSDDLSERKKSAKSKLSLLVMKLYCKRQRKKNEKKIRLCDYTVMCT